VQQKPVVDEPEEEESKVAPGLAEILKQKGFIQNLPNIAI